MKMTFNEEKHIYTINGDIADVSVTELLHKHNLAPNYAGVDKKVLEASAEKGKAVHKDLELIINENGYEPKTEQGKQFKAWVKENIDGAIAEQMVGLDIDGYKIAGTADFLGITKKGELVLGDHKNTYSFNREYVTWQANVLDYMFRRLNGEKLNGNKIEWKGAKKLYCFQYIDTKMQVKELAKIDDAEIERLLDCEVKGEKYERAVLYVEDEVKSEMEKAEMELEQAKAKVENYRAIIQQKMEEQGIKSFETEKIKITYVEAQDRISVDSTKLKKDYPDVYTKCQKLSKVKPSIRVKIREAKDED